MTVTITTAGLIAAQPEWNDAPAAVLAWAVTTANAKAYQDLYADVTLEEQRRYLEAGAILYTSPFARSMRSGQGSSNPYREEAARMDRLRGAACRGPGWELPAGAV